MVQASLSTNSPFQATADVTLLPGSWIELDLPTVGTGVGKFSGVWQHPDHGPLCSLSHFRTANDLAKRDTLYLPLKPDGQYLKALQSATLRDGPLKKR